MDCKMMEEIATYKPLIILIILMNMLSFFTIPLLFFVMMRISKNPLYHRNTKVLLVAHIIGLLIHLTNRIIYHGIEIYRFLIIMPTAGPCEIISTTERCFFLRLGFNLGMFFSICTTPVITFERFLATRFYSNYQKDQISWSVLLLFQFLWFSLIVAFTYAKTTFVGSTYYCLSASLELPAHILTALSIAFFLQVFSTVLYKYLIAKNQSLKKLLVQHGGNLSKRYQVEESLRSLQLLSQPIHTMLIVNSSAIFCSILIHLCSSQLNRPTLLFFVEALVVFPEYSLIFAISFIKKENRVNVEAAKSLQLNMNTDADAYFKNYKNAWN